jgi:periplasmic divalent cation tolerance protein
MSTPNEIVVLVTAPDKDEAASIAQVLVKEKLAACVNIITNIRSIYRWEGKIEDSPEILMVIKTQKSCFNALSAKVRELHSYTVPEIIALPVIDGSEDYLMWLRDSTRAD